MLLTYMRLIVRLGCYRYCVSLCLACRVLPLMFRYFPVLSSFSFPFPNPVRCRGTKRGLRAGALARDARIAKDAAAL